MQPRGQIGILSERHPEWISRHLRAAEKSTVGTPAPLLRNFVPGIIPSLGSLPRPVPSERLSTLGAQILLADPNSMLHP